VEIKKEYFGFWLDFEPKFRPKPKDRFKPKPKPKCLPKPKFRPKPIPKPKIADHYFRLQIYPCWEWQLESQSILSIYFIHCFSPVLKPAPADLVFVLKKVLYVAAIAFHSVFNLKISKLIPWGSCFISLLSAASIFYY
jgi:hypothetical protein